MSFKALKPALHTDKIYPTERQRNKKSIEKKKSLGHLR